MVEPKVTCKREYLLNFSYQGEEDGHKPQFVGHRHRMQNYSLPGTVSLNLEEYGCKGDGNGVILVFQIDEETLKALKNWLRLKFKNISKPSANAEGNPEKLSAQKIAKIAG